MQNKEMKETTSQTTHRFPPFSGGTFVVALSQKRVIRLGKKGRAGDPVGMLDAILTSDVPKDEGATTYALLLNAKGRILTDATVLRDGEELLLVVEEAGLEGALQTLGKYAPFSRVEVEETELFATGVFGDGAEALMTEPPAVGCSGRVEVGGREMLAFGTPLPLAGEILLSPGSPEELMEAMKAAGASVASEDDYETARIHAAVPKFGADITPDNFPAEAHLEGRAVDFTKGCYPGQETVARMHYRGQPNKYLHRFTVKEGEVAAGTPISRNGKNVGYVTSIAPLQINGETFALGYLKRKADPNGELVAGDAMLEVSAPETI